MEVEVKLNIWWQKEHKECFFEGGFGVKVCEEEILTVESGGLIATDLETVIMRNKCVSGKAGNGAVNM